MAELAVPSQRRREEGSPRLPLPTPESPSLLCLGSESMPTAPSQASADLPASCAPGQPVTQAAHRPPQVVISPQQGLVWPNMMFKMKLEAAANHSHIS